MKSSSSFLVQTGEGIGIPVVDWIRRPKPPTVEVPISLCIDRSRAPKFKTSVAPRERDLDPSLRQQCSDAQMRNVSHFENQGFEIQLDSMNPNDKESDSIQDEPERSSANILDTETNHSERAIVAHSGPGRQVQPNISYPELRLVVSIRFRELNWATQLLPRIAPRDNGKKMMEEWVHFRKEVRIKDISSLESLVKIEEQLLEWGETEEVSELFERRSLIPYKLFELEVEKVYHEHLANFKLDATPMNHDYFFIRRLYKELKVIATVHKNHRAMAGLPIANEELAMPTPTDPSTLQFMDTTTQTLTTLSTRVSSLDLTCASINDDTNLTRHHTTLLHEKLKNAVDGLDIKIDVLERTLSKRMDDSHQHFTKLETTMIHNYVDCHQQLVDELASVKSQLAAMVESIKEFGADKKGEGGQNRPGQGLNRTDEGSSDG
ncbi:hypothetical protein F511_27375 [Dorcoceras hygrometricum]|uniref:Uncharacterized protein n=1 Tax=Dorcoceras hygrometricum TaxID=472368 RepID=A0A2Z7BJV2_9LAMI|nr:hypothetical protein F511_27375 [Dorcoceras hygrometricum]